MSRWLSQVNSFLEKLDDQTQNYVEETVAAQEEANGVAGEESAANLDAILEQRGLATVSSEDDHNDDEVEPFSSSAAKDEEDLVVVPAANEDEEEEEVSDGVVVEEQDTHSAPAEDIVEESSKLTQELLEQSGQPSSEESDKSEKEAQSVVAKQESAVEEGKDGKNESDPVKVEQTKMEASASDAETSPKAEAATPATPMEAPGNLPVPVKAPPPPPPPPAKPTTASPSKEVNQKAQLKKAPPLPPPKQPPAAPPKSDPNPALIKERAELQKEVRTLRRHVVTLNKQLESVESEVTAQRKELEQAAVRMEKDRAKSKEERDKERKRHAEELKSVQAQHERTLMDQKTRMDQQVSDLSQKLRDMEQTRMQEGGNWDKELQGAVEREQILSQKNLSLEDEKATLLSQIGTLQSQQEALGDRIESLTHTADSAMEREREAEERLDQALSVHAHQISQRQARESELERTIAELGAAMASVRNKESSRRPDFHKNNEDDTAGENTSQDSGLRVRLDMALHDLETAQANLDLERQRTEALQRELREINSERTEEATNARMRQNKHDRQVAELTLQLSRLQRQSSSEIDKDGNASDRKESGSRDDAEIQGLKNQIKELSEEILKSRGKVGNFSSEIATLKSRLKGAVDRADKAEAALEESLAVQSTDSYDRMERGSPSSGNAIRRRGVGRSGSGTTSISSAMHLNKTERVGKAVDALDSFSVSTGKYLRYNPMARAAFLMYLMLLHLWTFVVIFFHAHNFEDIHREGMDLPHGPDSVVQKQLGAGGEAVAAAISAAKAAATAAVKPKQT